MSHYYTPLDVARALVRHAPKKLSALLEPAVGTGDLLEPLKHRLQSSSKIVCIDKDSHALSKLKTEYAALWKNKLEIICADFLNWSPANPDSKKGEGFDCVLMNPPFDGKRGNFVELNCPVALPEGGEVIRRVPIEVAFVLKAVRLLRPGGRLLAVVPSSVVASLSTTWLREYLLQVGAVKYVHELPHFTFEDLGARVYLFVFEKQERQRSLILLNHDLAEPEKFRIRRADLSPDFRFDYGFYNAQRWFEELKEKKKRLRWLPINEVAEVLRGNVESPEGARRAIHTTNYKEGFWVAGARRKQLKRGNTHRQVRRHDLIMKRVGRDCSKTLGSVTDACGYATSDCVVIIRPLKSSNKLKLLFAIRTILGAGVGTALLERGTGAPYLTVAELPDLQIPMNLADVYHQTFSEYKLAVTARKFSEMLAIEEKVRRTFEVSAAVE
jgi:tRNA1(Val) A37 N6-methylase TrmN6